MGLPTASDLYSYDPSGAAAILFNVLYSILISPHFVLSCWRCRSRRIKHRYTVCLLIAAIISTAGYSIRVASVNHRGNVTLYATSSSLIVISPIFVCAALYLLLARMVERFLPVRHQTFFTFSPRLLGKLFISSDVISFMTQGAGSGIAASGNWQGSLRTTGIDVLLVGLALQLATFTFFLLVSWRFVGRVRTVVGECVESNLEKMLTGAGIAAILVEIRSVYRVVEFALGIDGYPFQHEWPLYVLEATPVFLAIGILAWYHPVNLMQKSARELLDDGADTVVRKHQSGAQVKGSER